MKIQREWFMKSLRIILPLLILFFIFYKSNDYFQKLDWSLAISQIPKIGFWDLSIILLLGFIAASFMIYYDILFNNRLSLNIPIKKLVKYSLIANTFNNVLGFGGLAGASIRSTFFKKHHANFKQLLKTIAWATPLMFAGVSALLIFVVMSDIHTFIDFKGDHLLKPVLWGIVLFLPVYLLILFAKNKLTNKTDREFIIKMLAVSVVEWFLCFFVFYAISELLNVSVSFPFLYGLFFVGKFISVVSMTPGGIGTFDLVLLEGFDQHGVVKETGLLIVVLYRISYYALPWLIGIVLAISEMVPASLRKRA
ncbi:lysylphosphatidylglycerol synthase domain-containing protein [Peribacillus sp. SCS-155]|uniref:lysylphosphatidylglycerol synthase domain-containing protein n=1 Tax=Peribacillus sedimenti TaxID=3115297 RepID=UPI003905F47D